MVKIEFVGWADGSWWDSYADPLDELARATAYQLRAEQLRKLNERAADLIHAVFGYGHWQAGWRNDFNVEEFWPDGADEPDMGQLRIECDGCHRLVAPFRSRTLTPVDGGWRWVGLDHKEPYTDYFAVCGWCGQPVTFTVHSPQ